MAIKKRHIHTGKSTAVIIVSLNFMWPCPYVTLFLLDFHHHTRLAGYPSLTLPLQQFMPIYKARVTRNLNSIIPSLTILDMPVHIITVYDRN